MTVTREMSKECLEKTVRPANDWKYQWLESVGVCEPWKWIAYNQLEPCCVPIYANSGWMRRQVQPPWIRESVKLT